MFQQLNDQKLDADEKKDKLVVMGWIAGGLLLVAGLVWFMVRHTIAS